MADPTTNDPTPGRPDVVVVVGASAGGIAALQRFLAVLTPDFQGAVCIVLHLSPNRRSYLAEILARVCALPVRTARHGDDLLPGSVYVAPPDHHLVVEPDLRLTLDAGPNENGHRPAVDVLFRSAARALQGGAIGVILSGALDDGAAGLREIKARGGRAAVQDPVDADYDGMPSAALDAVTPDLLGSATDIARWLGTVGPGPTSGVPADRLVLGAAEGRIQAPYITCPDCHGALHEVTDGELVRYECLISHKWSAASLEAFQQRDVEIALWAAVRALEEQAVLNKRLAERSDRLRRPRAGDSFRDAAARAHEQSAMLRQVAEEVGSAQPVNADPHG